MSNIRSKQIFLVLSAAFMVSSCNAFQMTKPYNQVIVPQYKVDQRWGVLGIVETSYENARGFDACGSRVNITRIWDRDQNALAAMKGLIPDVSLDVIDDCKRGHFLTCGDLRLKYTVNIGAQYGFAHYCNFSVFLPFYSMSLCNVRWKELTETDSGQDLIVREELTNNFFYNVGKYGQGLWLQEWNRAGVGDLSFMLSAANEFNQYRRLLKKVYINGRIGVTLPTGLKQDEDLIFALPFGYDGAVGLFFGGGLTITAELISQQIRAGFDVDLTHIFGNTKVRRIKTNIDQTEPLLLKKVCAYKDWGMTQLFTLHLQWYHFYKGLSIRAAYQYYKQGAAELSLMNNDFSTEIANTANSLREWTAHNFIPIVTYDFNESRFLDDTQVCPTLSIFAKVPFDGTRAIQFPTIGSVLTVRW